MSLLNFIGGNLRQTTPQRPEATTAKADVSIHAHLSTPSRHGSLGVLTPTQQGGRKAPSRSQTDSFPYTDPRGTSAPSFSNPDKKHNSWRALSRVLRSSPAASKTSLLSQEADSESGPSTPPQPLSDTKPQPQSSRSALSRRVSTSSEREWTEVGKDSSDDDEDPGTPQDEGRKPAQALEESVIVVEDPETVARRLKEEVADTHKKLEGVTNECADTHKKLEGVTNECAALKERIQVLERENKERDHEKRLLEKATNEERAEVSRAHAKELDDKCREIRELLRSSESRKCDLREKSERMEVLVQENGVLRRKVASLEKRGVEAEMEIEAMRKDVEIANAALRTVKDKNAASLAESREEKRKLVDQVDQLWCQLGDLQRSSRERDQQIQELQATEETTKDAFRRVQTTVSEKDAKVEDLLRRNASLAKEVEKLRGQVDGMETDAVESQNAAQRLLAKTREDHRQEMADANNKIQSLQDEISSYMSVAQDLRSSLNAKRAEAEKAAKRIERRAAEIQRLEQELSALQITLSDKDQELLDSAASRASQSHLEDTIRTLRERIAKLEDEQTHNLRQSQLETTSAVNEAKLQTARVEKELSLTHEKLRHLRKRYESSEHTREMLRDQLTRREDDKWKGRSDPSGIASASSKVRSDTSGSTSVSSIIRDTTAPSDQQVYNLLQTLNYQTFQTAALLADSLCNIDRPSSHSSHDNSDATSLIDPETTSLIGTHLLSLVRSQSTLSMSDYNPLPLQTALQATLICCASRIMTAWYPGHWDLSDFLSATHLRIRAAEGIIASETWRMTTRARLRPTTATIPLVVEFMSECLATVFQYAGWTLTSGSKDQTVESLLHSNREKLSALARLALRLNVILDSVKPQLEPMLVEPGSTFDPRVMEREDADAGDDEDSEVGEDNEVVCMSEIGLRKAAEPITTGEESREWRRKRGVVLKPKVILRSSLDL